MSSMPVHHKNQSVVRPFDEPRGIGYISVDCDKKLHFDRSQMKYYKEQDTSFGLRLALNTGYRETIQRNFKLADKMNETLKWIAHSGTRPLADFVTERDILARVLCSPYFSGPNYEWTICASKFKNVIYFAEVETDTLLQNSEFTKEREKQLRAWDYKFKEYVTSDVRFGARNLSSKRTHPLEGFSIMLSNQLNNHTLLYRAEVDGFNSNCNNLVRKEDMWCYVELETSKLRHACPSVDFFQKVTSLKWWARSHIVGIPVTVCGLRDDLGIVDSILSHRTADLPDLCQEQWKPVVCFNFCQDFLKFLKEEVLEDDYRVVYKLEYKENPVVTCEKLRLPEERYRIIPDWFVEEMNKLR